MNKRQVGTTKEALAEKLLILNGYEVIEKNYRCRKGEVDIVASRDGYLIFVEVKYRKTKKYGLPMEAVDFKKQAVISAVSDVYRIQHKIPEDKKIRYDVVAILGDTYKIIPNAFTYVLGIPSKSTRKY